MTRVSLLFFKIFPLVYFQACLSDLERERDKVSETLKKMKDESLEERLRKWKKKKEMRDQGKKKKKWKRKIFNLFAQ